MERAIEVFVHGHRFVRSFTHTCEAERVGGMWVMRDALRTSGNYRREEWMACGMNPKTVDGIVRKHARGHYSVCAFLGVDEPDCWDAFKALGYRLGHTEPLMVHGPAACSASEIACNNSAYRDHRDG
jgi:hypothetical protein